MGIRKSQVKKIEKARRDFGIAQRGGDRAARARTTAALDAVLRNSSEEEQKAGYAHRVMPDDGIWEFPGDEK